MLSFTIETKYNENIIVTKKPETIALHAGQESPDQSTGARAVPIYQTTSFNFKNADHAANLFALKAFGVSSRQAAETLALLAITHVCDDILSANNLYGGTYELFHYTFPKLGRKVKFVDSTKSMK